VHEDSRRPESRSHPSPSIGRGCMEEDLPLWRKVTLGEKRVGGERTPKGQSTEFIQTVGSGGQVSEDPSLRRSYTPEESGIGWSENSRRPETRVHPSRPSKLDGCQ
jgi:hypothetical protein